MGAEDVHSDAEGGFGVAGAHLRSSASFLTPYQSSHSLCPSIPTSWDTESQGNRCTCWRSVVVDVEVTQSKGFVALDRVLDLEKFQPCHLSSSSSIFHRPPKIAQLFSSTLYIDGKTARSVI